MATGSIDRSVSHKQQHHQLHARNNVEAGGDSVAAPIVEFEAAMFNAKGGKIPVEFVWPEAAAESGGAAATDERQLVPTIDMAWWREGGEKAAAVAAAAAAASREVGFFQVVNHGVDAAMVKEAEEVSREFFEKVPREMKRRVERIPGQSYGYASSFTSRFSSRLPWKETFSLLPSPAPSNISQLLSGLLRGGGDDEEDTAVGTGGDAAALRRLCHHGSEVLEKYSQSMIQLALEILDVLSAGLGLRRAQGLRRFFDPDHSSILRLNYYPPCLQPWLTYGTGPHTDPTGLTLLHQDCVSGLQVFHQGHWYNVAPCNDAFVVNIGDTLMALTNERYKSCLHRALVNQKEARGSIAFFFNPGFNTLLSPPEELIDETNPRAYHEFTWAKFLYFTQSVHRSGVNTLHTFNQWLSSQS